MSVGAEAAVSASTINSLGAGRKSEGEELGSPAMVRRIEAKNAGREEKKKKSQMKVKTAICLIPPC